MSASASPRVDQTGINDDALLALVSPDPVRPGKGAWRLTNAGIPVWALIGHLRGLTDRDLGTERGPAAAIARTATDYGITEAEVRAALAFYRRERAAIDARLDENAAALRGA